MPLGLTAASSFAFGFVLCIAASKRNSGTQMYQLPLIHEYAWKYVLRHRGLKLDGAIGQGEICKSLTSEKFSTSFLSHIGKNKKKF